METFKKIKRYIASLPDIKRLEGENKELRKEVDRLMVHDGTARKIMKMSTTHAVLARVLGRPLKFYEYEELPYVEQVKHYNAAREILFNRAFINETNAIIKDCMEDIALNAEDMKRVDQLRYTIVGVKLIQERLEEIQKPEFKENTEEGNLHDGI